MKNQSGKFTGIGQMLSRDQMKRIKGGTGGNCQSDPQCPEQGFGCINSSGQYGSCVAVFCSEGDYYYYMCEAQ